MLAIVAGSVTQIIDRVVTKTIFGADTRGRSQTRYAAFSRRVIMLGFSRLALSTNLRS